MMEKEILTILMIGAGVCCLILALPESDEDE